MFTRVSRIAQVPLNEMSNEFARPPDRITYAPIRGLVDISMIQYHNIVIYNPWKNSFCYIIFRLIRADDCCSKRGRAAFSSSKRSPRRCPLTHSFSFSLSLSSSLTVATLHRISRRKFMRQPHETEPKPKHANRKKM